MSNEILPGVGHDDRTGQIPITIICSNPLKKLQCLPSHFSGLSKSPSDMIRTREAVLLLLCLYIV